VGRVREHVEEIHLFVPLSSLDPDPNNDSEERAREVVIKGG
jgi:hypothetical protein